MSDDARKDGPLDRFRINADDDKELQYWANEFGCTVLQLKKAVRQSGVMVADVARCLKRKI
jgi:hypothetical protein